MAFFEALRSAGVADDRARCAVDALRLELDRRDHRLVDRVEWSVFDATVAKNFADQRVEWRGEFAAVREEIAELRGEMQAEFASVRGEMRSEIAVLRGEMRTEIASVREEIAVLRGEMRTEIAAVRTEVGELRSTIADLKSDLVRWVAALFLAQIAVVGFLVRLLH